MRDLDYGPMEMYDGRKVYMPEVGQRERPIPSKVQVMYDALRFKLKPRKQYRRRRTIPRMKIPNQSQKTRPRPPKEDHP